MRKESSTNFENEQVIHEFCDAAFALNAIKGRWKLNILSILLEHDLRYKDLKNRLPNITDRVLTLQLKEMERDGLILKGNTADDLPYQLSTAGLGFKTIVEHLAAWGQAQKSQNIAPRK